MIRDTYVIPPAGTINHFPVDGRSIIIESAPSYFDKSDVPIITFRSGEVFPIYSRSKYEHPDFFNGFQIKGTSASAGDEVGLLISDDCLGTELNINLLQTERIDSGQNYKVDFDDTVGRLPNTILFNANNQLATSLDVYVVGASCLVGYGGRDPKRAIGSSNYGHRLQYGEHYKINGQDKVQTFAFTALESGIHGSLIITPEY